MDYQPGDTLLNKYRFAEDALIGRGAFGDVYRVTHITLGVPRAIKVLRRDAPGMGSTLYQDVQQRFLLEGRLGARLHRPVPNPHLIQVYDFIIGEDLLLLEMEYMAGGSLAERINKYKETQNAFPLKDALQIAAQIAAGLAALHALDVIHRDLKPANILFDEQGQAHIADLGVAQIPGGPTQRTGLGEEEAPPHPGTVEYMSPEQARTRGILKSSSDIYALGLVLFEMLTGRNYSYLRPGTRARSLRAEIPTGLDDLLARMLSEAPGERPWDGQEAADSLKAALAALINGDIANPKSKIVNPESQIQNQPAPGALTIELAPGVSMEFVRVPAGEFLMGSDKSEDKLAQDRETPQHKVILNEYLIGKTPVTNRQYQVFVQAAGYKQPEHWKNGEIPDGKQEHPVVYVNWQDAVAFCAWASQVSGSDVRLPSEAEWEKAARGTDGRLYPWGNQLPDAKCCNFGRNVTGTTPVGKYSPAGDGPYGCTDMAGNVWEWVNDWFDDKYYRSSPVINPAGPASGVSRVMRGGSWYYNGDLLRVSYRSWFTPDNRFNSGGFRCAIVEVDFSSQVDSIEKAHLAGDGNRKEMVIQVPQEKESKVDAEKVAKRNDAEKSHLDQQRKKEPEQARLEAERKLRDLIIELAPGVSMEFVRVPAGEFLMGSNKQKDKQAQDNETPQHKVILNEYLIGKTPVTNRQYQAFVQAAGYKQPEHWKNGEFPDGKQEHPVVMVLWRDAAAFCAWASQVSGSDVRLPSEAEWEKAARGTDGRLYPWGDQAPDAWLCNFGRSVGDTSPVGKYSPNGDSRYGCADMAGNVWEWVNDWFDDKYYQSSPVNNPAGPVRGTNLVLRGGSWYNNVSYMRVSFRDRDGPGLRGNDFIGFRCSR